MWLHVPLQITAWRCMGSSWCGCARTRRLDPMDFRSLSLAELVGALVRDAPHELADLFPGLAFAAEAERDFLALPPAPQLQLALKVLGEVEVGGPALVEVRDRAELL